MPPYLSPANSSCRIGLENSPPPSGPPLLEARVLASCVEACEQSDVIRALCVAGDTTANQEDVFSAVGGVAFPDLSALDEMEAAFDWNAAKTSGRIEPARGVDADLDAAEDRLAAADDALESWLERARVDLGGHKTEVCFVNANKDTHLVEVPDRLAAKVPNTGCAKGSAKDSSGLHAMSWFRFEQIVSRRRRLARKRSPVSLNASSPSFANTHRRGETPRALAPSLTSWHL